MCVDLNVTPFLRKPFVYQQGETQIQIATSPTLHAKFSTHRMEEQTRALVPQWPLGRGGLQLMVELHPADREEAECRDLIAPLLPALLSC